MTVRRGLQAASRPLPNTLSVATVERFVQDTAERQAAEEFRLQALSPRRGIQSRKGESEQGYSILAEIYALIATEHFWDLASVFPHNNVTDPALRPLHGRPRAFPDWMLFLVECAAGRQGAASIRKALTDMRDPRVWLPLVPVIDAYVPAGWTRLSDLPSATPTLTLVGGKKKKGKPKAVPAPPKAHHMDYWMRLMRGVPIREEKVVVGYEQDETGEYASILDTLNEKMRTSAMSLMQSMGALDPAQPFAYRSPDRDQFVRFDGTVFALNRKRRTDSADEHACGGEEKLVYGTKFTIASARLDGQYHSRIFLGLEHNGPTSAPEHRNEAISTVTMAEELSALSNGGMKGIIVDSVIRGNHLIRLQRNGVTVVNWPHAKSNKGPKTHGYRRNAGRVEKNHLATVCEHVDDAGLVCKHPHYWVDGDLCEATRDVNGEIVLTLVRPDKYEDRPNRDGTRREYFIFTMNCPHAAKPVKCRVGLFHVDGASKDPDFNFGEVVRVYGPANPDFQFLYGARNDAESRHTNLKARIKYLPMDVFGQSLRALTAMVTSNCVSYQWHLKHRSMPNQIDGIA